MTTPFRQFYHLLKARADASSLGPPPFSVAADWTTIHSEIPYIHFQAGGGANKYENSFIILRGRREDGWEGLSGADTWMKVFMFAEILPAEYDTVPCTYYKFVTGVLHDPHGAADEPDYGYLSGRWYKATEVEWPAFPIDYDWSYAGYTPNLDPADLPITQRLCIPAWDTIFNNFVAIPWTERGLKNGVVIAEYSHGGGGSAGEGYTVDINVQRIEPHYMNPMTNAFSRYVMPEVGGPPLVLTGLGFDNDDDEIEEGGHARPGGWDDRVDYIYIQKPDGTAVQTLSRLLGHFTVNSNTQITIPAWPALARGIYQLYLRKQEGTINIYGYAGDWRTAASGRMTAGERLYIVVGESTVPPGPRTKWRWRKGDDYIFRWYAPIDTRATMIFYDGMILGISAFTRGTSDDRGLPVFPDIELDMDNTTQEFSKLLAAYWIKNQPVEIFYGYRNEPDVVKAHVFRGIVTDYSKPHSRWKVRLRDVLEKYLKVKIPKYKCTVEEYPNIHPNAVGREMPEILGRARLTEAPAPGAVEAICIDTVNYEYLAARGSLKAVSEVYSDGQLINAANYAIVYKDGGRTYIKFTSNKKEAKITFNADGYAYDEWDDTESGAGAFVRNPAYIILFLLAFFAEIPEPDVDIPAFEALADVYAAMGAAQDGYLILQDQKDAEGPLQELLWTYGAKLWENLDGQITIGRKSAQDIAASLILFDQIDALQEPDKPIGFDQAINYAPLQWEYYPTANAFFKSKIASRQASIDAFETEMMPGTPWDFPWTTSETLVDQRAQEELLKLGFGNQKIIFPVSIEHLDQLEILENFKFQDPFGLHPTGLGEEDHRYYIESLTYDLLAGTIGITGIDLAWAMRQYFIYGDETVLSPNWSTAAEAEKLWAYLADETTGKFADGDPGKQIIDENEGG